MFWPCYFLWLSGEFSSLTLKEKDQKVINAEVNCFDFINTSDPQELSLQRIDQRKGNQKLLK